MSEGKGLVPSPPPWRQAKSLETAKPGEVVVYDGSGRLLTWRRKALLFVLGGLGGLAIAAIHELLTVHIGAWAGHVLVVGLGLAAVRYYVQLIPLARVGRKALTLLSLRRYREAGELVAPRLADRRCHPILLRIGAVSAWTRGEHGEAMRLLELGAPRATGGERALNAACRVMILATADRLDEAKALRAAMPPSPGGLLGEQIERSVVLTLAFHADDRSLLPADDVLHAWAREALMRDHLRGELVYLSWAAWRIGDEEMARHLLAEAAPVLRLGEPDLGSPRLSAWIDARAGEWGIVLGAPAAG